MNVLNYRFTLIGALLGGFAGFAYWYFIGCTSGGCPITTNPYLTSGYGSLIGLILTWPNNKKQKDEKENMDIQTIVKTQNPTIIDVRTPGEFQMDHAKTSLNIPLNEVPARLAEFQSMKKPIVLCCASGGRSGQAAQFLKNNGVDDVYNAGSYSIVKNFLI